MRCAAGCCIKSVKKCISRARAPRGRDAWEPLTHIESDSVVSADGRHVYCPFAYKWWVVLLTHCPQICVRKEVPRPGFLYVNR